MRVFIVNILNSISIIVIVASLYMHKQDYKDLEFRVKTNEDTIDALTIHLRHRNDSLQDRLELMINKNAVKIDNLEYILGRKYR